MSTHVINVYNIIQSKIDFDKFVPTCLIVAKEVQLFTHLTGSEKLKFAQEILRYAVDQSNRNDKENILSMIDTTVPIIMEAAKIASKLPIKSLKFCC